MLSFIRAAVVLVSLHSNRTAMETVVTATIWSFYIFGLSMIPAFFSFQHRNRWSEFTPKEVRTVGATGSA